MGYRIPFLSRPPLSAVPIPMPSYNPLSTKGVALGEVTQALIAKGAVELAPLPSPGFYSRLFVVWKTSGSWRPVIDLSTLNRFVDVSHFRMETIQSVLLSVRQGDWMASIDLKEAYLQVPIHPESCPFLRFVAHGCTYQFTALCFGLSMGPQVFFPGHGCCFRNPPFLGYSHASIPRRLACPVVLLRVSPPGPPGGTGHLSGAGHCHQPGEIQPRALSGCAVSWGGDRCQNFCGFSIAGTHLSSADPPASIWLSLLGHALLDVPSSPWR